MCITTMKKICLLLLCIVISNGVYAQNIDSVKVTPKPHPLTQNQRDSLLMSIESNVEYLAKEAADLKKHVGRYKVYRTTNIYNSLKLDTATGQVTALQIGINNDKSRFEYSVCDAIETDYDWMIVGRYELYPTGNNYNFILIDTIFGRSYQVQWSTESNQCGRWRIW